MRPQRKPFVVEIKKTKQFCRKPVPAEVNRAGAVQAGAGAVDKAARSGDRT